MPVCLTQANTIGAFTFFLMTISIFFLLPLMVLIILYAIIAKKLIMSDTKMKMRLSKPELSVKARKQVVLMLGAVVLSFFTCLLPFRMLTLWIISVPEETFQQLSVDTYYNLLYFCRIMWYLNSAVNPILYNLMSSKFRKGFFKLCRCCLVRYRRRSQTRVTNFNTTTTSSYLTNSHHRRSVQSGRITLSLDDLRLQKQVKRLENSSTTSPTSGSEDESWYALNLQRQSSSPLLSFTNRPYRKKSAPKSPSIRPIVFESSCVASPPPNGDLRRLALKNKMHKEKNISFDDSSIYESKNKRIVEYHKQTSVDDALLGTCRLAEICSLTYIDETPDTDKTLMDTLSPFLNQAEQDSESVQEKGAHCR